MVRFPSLNHRDRILYRSNWLEWNCQLSLVEHFSDYPDYSNTFSTSGSYFTAVKYEDDNDQEVEEKYRIPEGRPDPPPYNNYDSVQDY